MLLKSKLFLLSALLFVAAIQCSESTYQPDEEPINTAEELHMAVDKAMAYDKEQQALDLLERYQHFIRENPNRLIPGSEDYDRRHLIHIAAEDNYPKIIRLLIQYGVNRNIEDRRELTPLEIARLYNNAEAEEALLNEPNSWNIGGVRLQVPRLSLRSFVPSWFMNGNTPVGSN